ncbi:MAG TPA: glycosyltransferase family 39 protein, partial [Candidatus Omnitrophota bacterium]|nr:glycosyltransferase family 39 protein [Candidatus Omnitrophota bacterium]
PLMFMQYGIQMFGFNYLGWRFFSALFGALSVAVFYLLVNKLFSSRAALIASLLLSIDFLHLALSRVALVDIYLFFFLITAFYFLAQSLEHEISEGLLLSGTFFGLALSTQWTAAFSILAGLVIYLSCSKDPKRISKGMIRLVVYPALLCVAALLYLDLSAGLNAFSWIKYGANDLVYRGILAYHKMSGASPLGWPLLLRSTPLFFTQMGAGLVQAVIAIGNPAVYWPIIPVMLFLINRFANGKDLTLPYLFVMIGFFGSYLPWAIYEALGKLYVVNAGNMLFYYFLPSVPFFLAGLAALLDRWLDDRYGKILVPVYLVLVFVLFLAFSPVIYGFAIPPVYLNCLNWLPGWIP